ncbi:fructose-bisphosphate aldolase [Drepanopeziza brunnea f. sp. 'multigermtubi' MB_m1]|uniref:fructose-bisphosphate aldolase n=1 Tax=Marssonina brunnea f. sp. multigermtubi (strain MB_m1) TaxID=1072389 RepID=K1WTJ8_MARBU|nr:fructose-bisphosphate aldolase [Drepanopeziza brunnea f. sp. 'multigermtubi' MB_m1]EKD15762.1 fructose-bisphosphate aldolase [Drepanopeziza brunnea f. sp. 'multigermtubi' MB_m1]
MASPFVSKAPQCLSCIRRVTSSLGEAFHFSAGQHIRGKKNLAKVSTVKVHLLQNIPGYGKRGSVIQVPPGVMRNIWFPKKMAEYLTLQKIKELGVKKDAVVERDSTFRSNAERKLERQLEKEQSNDGEGEESEPLSQTISEQEDGPAPIVELELLNVRFFGVVAAKKLLISPQPEQATTLLDQLLPANLDFYRTVITLEAPAQRISPSIPSSSATSRAAANNSKLSTPGKENIYGSVSTSDIAANLKAVLAEDEEGVRIVLSPENISFVGETEEKDRVKHLGVFEIDIQLDGATESVRRTIKVNAQGYSCQVIPNVAAQLPPFRGNAGILIGLWRSIVVNLGLDRGFMNEKSFDSLSSVRNTKAMDDVDSEASGKPSARYPSTTSAIVNMGATDVLSRKSGVIVGDDVLKLFNYAQEHNFAIPAINCTSSSTVIASLEAARDAKAPIILQMSQGGAAYFAGKGVGNKDQEASIAGGIAAAHYIRAIAPIYGVPVILHTDHCAKKLLPWLDGLMDADEAYFKAHGEPLFSSHMIDLSEEEVEYNIETTAKYLKRAAPMKQWLEMEIGITGGEEDGVNNEDVDNNSLYTQPEDILAIYKALSPISPYFSIAAGFGNVHGVYKPGNVKLHPELLGKHQKFVKDAIGAKEEKPVFLVFHGGSGSSKKEFSDAISYGVVKVNLDTDLQYAYLTGIRDYVLNKKDYLMAQVGNPDGEDKPNKKYFDPRVWVREGEKTMSARVAEGLKDFNTAGQL